MLLWSVLLICWEGDMLLERSIDQLGRRYASSECPVDLLGRKYASLERSIGLLAKKYTS